MRVSIGRIPHFLSIALLTLLPAIVSGSTADAALPAFGIVANESLEQWKNFRRAQPFQVHVIALQPGVQQATPTLILTEPPPQITWESLQARLAAFSSGCAVRRWQLMYDGWVQDVVCTVKPTLQDSALAEAIAGLQVAVFGTGEGRLVRLPAPSRKMIKHSLDLQYSAEDLLRWLNEGGTSYRTNALGSSVPLAELVSGRRTGVFTREDEGLVLWVIPRNKPLNDLAEARRFSLASDLVLGAIATQSTVTLVGRGRVEPIAHLPPMRAETILQLAGSQQQELAQSYERRDVLAGKAGDGIDYAPILLSPQLVDTEFGSLLNIADQLLKGWSEAGTVKYLDFPYPAPRTFPFGSKLASAVEEPQRRSFLYNWNTDGVAYRQKLGGIDFLVPQRTGALSVIYGDPTDRPRLLEDQAYNYFAQSGDATLVRVVQYTFLFQVFRTYNVSSESPPVSPRHARFRAHLNAATEARFRTVLRQMSDDQVATALSGYVKATWGTKPLPPNLTHKRSEISARQLAGHLDRATTLRTAEKATNGGVTRTFMTLAAVFRRELKPSDLASQEFRTQVTEVALAMPPEHGLAFMRDPAAYLKASALMYIAPNAAKEWLSISDARDPGFRWTRTAYVVASDGGVTSVGGHNVDSRVVRLDVNQTLKQGEVLVFPERDGSLTIHHSPADTGNGALIAREGGTRKSLKPTEIAAEISSKLKSISARPRVEFASIRRTVPDHAALEYTFMSPTRAGIGTRTLSAREKTLLIDLGSGGEQAIVMEQTADGAFILMRTGSERAIETASLLNATDALATGMLASAGGASKLSVMVKGMPNEKAEAIVGQVQASLRRYPKETVDHIISSAADEVPLVQRPKLLNTKFAHEGIQVDRAGIKVTRVHEGPYAGMSRVEVPLKVTQPTTSFWMKIIFYIRDASAATLDLLASKLTALLSNVKGPISPRELRDQVAAQLREDLSKLRVDAVLMEVPGSEAANKIHTLVIGAAASLARVS